MTKSENAIRDFISGKINYNTAKWFMVIDLAIQLTESTEIDYDAVDKIMKLMDALKRLKTE